MNDQGLEEEFNNLNKIDLPIKPIVKDETNFFNLSDNINVKNFSALRYTINVPSNPGSEGELILVKTSGSTYIYTYIDSNWRRVLLS